MKKPDEEISGVDAGLSDTDVTFFGPGGSAEKVLTKMSERLNYSKNIFGIGEVLGADESGGQSVKIWDQSIMLTVKVSEPTEAAFEEGLENELRKHDRYKDRF